MGRHSNPLLDGRFVGRRARGELPPPRRIARVHAPVRRPGLLDDPLQGMRDLRSSFVEPPLMRLKLLDPDPHRSPPFQVPSTVAIPEHPAQSRGSSASSDYTHVTRASIAAVILDDKSAAVGPDLPREQLALVVVHHLGVEPGPVIS